MSLWRPAASACLLVLLIGCSDTDGAGTDPAPSATETASATETTSAAEPTSEPPVEPTDPETTQSTQEKPSISIASAPIGGNVETDGEEQCAEVNWLGVNPIPDGTTIDVGAPQLDPGGVFQLYQEACAQEFRACKDVRWQADSFKPCYVGVRQIGTSDEPVQLIMSVSATCATEEDCKSLEGDRPGSQISFRPGAPGG